MKTNTQMADGRNAVHGPRLATFLAAAAAAAAWLAAGAQGAGPGPAVSFHDTWKGPRPGPARIAVGPQGHVYVAHPKAGALVVRDAFGRLVRVQGGLREPLGVATDRTGKVYVAEAGAQGVAIFNAEGERVGALGQGEGEFQLPGHVAVGTAGEITTVYVSDLKTHQVKAYRNGIRAWTAGGQGNLPGQFSLPTGLAVNAAGEVLVVDQENDRVQVLDGSGASLRSFSLRPPGRTTRSGRPQGIAVDALGRIYVADMFQGYLRVYDAQGGFVSVLGAYGTSPGQFQSPADLAIDPAGRLLVANLNNDRVEVLGLDCGLRLTANPAQEFVAAGAKVTFSVTPDCQGEASYQWRKGETDLVNAGNISGATSPTLTLSSVTVADSGTYAVRVTRAGGTIEPARAQLRVVTAPVLTRALNNLTVAQGGSAVFEVAATGGNLSYQWFFNGSAVAGAVEPRLSLVPVRATDQGTYVVRVSNPAGTINSTGTLTVLEPPLFVQHPIGETVPERGSFALYGICTSNLPTSFQWYFKGALLSGQTRSTFTQSNATPAHTGGYFLVAQNTAGRATSDVASVTVTPDTVPPQVLRASGGRATNRTITLGFSKNLNPATAQNTANYALIGPGGRTITSAVLSQGSNVVLTLSGARFSYENYAVRVASVLDTAYTPNLLSPNPTVIPVTSLIELVGINNTPWKYLQPTNNVLDAQPWKTPAFNDANWTTGFGIFYGNRTNSVFQPQPNPNVKLPLILNASDPTNNRVYTILNVFTNAGNVLRTTTYYFRTTFNFPATTNGATLLLYSMLDDGAVFWLNGQEMRRDRMPTGTPVFSTLASSSGNQSWSPTLSSEPRVLPLTGLKTGTNTLAVELHPRTTTDDDVTLGVWLQASVTNFVAGASPRPELGIRINGEVLQVTWGAAAGYVLEVAPVITGPWVIVNTSSPYQISLTNAQAGANRFFRLRRVE